MKDGKIDNVYGLGLCYLFTQDLRFNPDMGLANPYPPCAGYPKERDHAEYGLCQAGTGAYITEVNIQITVNLWYLKEVNANYNKINSTRFSDWSAYEIIFL